MQIPAPVSRQSIDFLVLRFKVSSLLLQQEAGGAQENRQKGLTRPNVHRFWISLPDNILAPKKWSLSNWTAKVWAQEMLATKGWGGCGYSDPTPAQGIHCLRASGFLSWKPRATPSIIVVVFHSLSCVWLCSPTDCSTPGFPVLHHLPEHALTHAHWDSDAIQPRHLTVIPFSSCLQSFPASGSFPMSWLFTSGGQGIGASASASILSVNVQGWFPEHFQNWLVWSPWSPRDSQESSPELQFERVIYIQ